MRDHAQPATQDVGEEVDKAKAAAEQEYEYRDRGGGATGGEPQSGQVEHRWKREAQHAAGCGDGLGQRQPDGNQLRGEEVDHERVAKAVARVDRVLGRKVVTVGERAGEAQMSRPVAPDIDIARVQAGWCVDVRLVQEVDRPHTTYGNDPGQRPLVAAIAKGT